MTEANQIIDVEITQGDIDRAVKNQQSPYYEVCADCLLAVALGRHFQGVAEVGARTFDINHGPCMYLDRRAREIINKFDEYIPVSPCTIGVSYKPIND